MSTVPPGGGPGGIFWKKNGREDLGIWPWILISALENRSSHDLTHEHWGSLRLTEVQAVKMGRLGVHMSAYPVVIKIAMKNHPFKRQIIRVVKFSCFHGYCFDYNKVNHVLPINKRLLCWISNAVSRFRRFAFDAVDAKMAADPPGVSSRRNGGHPSERHVEYLQCYGHGYQL